MHPKSLIIINKMTELNFHKRCADFLFFFNIGATRGWDWE